MIQCNNLNVKWSDSQLRKLASLIKINIEVIVNLYQMWLVILFIKLFLQINHY